MNFISRKIGGIDSIEKRLSIYNTLVLAIVIFVIVLFAVSNFNFLSLYNRSVSLSKDLSLVYKNFNSGKEYIQSFFYTQSPNDYTGYSYQIQRARDNINNLQKNIFDSEINSKFSSLDNMLLTYDERINEIKKSIDQGDIFSTEKYDYIIRLDNLINTTSVDYFNMITQYTSEKRKEIIGIWRAQIGITFFVVIMAIGVGLDFSIKTTKSITNPIGKIIDNIQNIKRGKYDLKEVKNAGKEIGILLGAFEDMAKSIEKNVNAIEEKAKLERQLLENENENLRISNLLIDSELRVLQGQINPHFLYNTISMLSKTAYIEGANTTSELMEATADLLRYGMDKSNKLSDLYSELNCVKNYFHIQRQRFGERVKFTLEYGENLPNVAMPGMILQPLLENSVMHGIKDSTEDGLVKVQVSYRDEKVAIVIEDNGAGFKSDVLEMVQIEGNSDSIIDYIQNQKETSGMGLFNVQKRLQMHFRESASFQIESSEGCGTVITIILPGR